MARVNPCTIHIRAGLENNFHVAKGLFKGLFSLELVNRVSVCPVSAIYTAVLIRYTNLRVAAYMQGGPKISHCQVIKSSFIVLKLESGIRFVHQIKVSVRVFIV